MLVERDRPALQAGLVALQAVWAAALLRACAGWSSAAAERKLVVQGG